MIQNICLDIFGIIVCFIVGFTKIDNKIRFKGKQLFTLLLYLVLTLLLLDICTWILDTRVFFGSIVATNVLNTAYYVLQTIFIYCWLRYTAKWLGASVFNVEKYKLVYALPMVSMVIMSLLSPFANTVFNIDSNNVYSRGALFNLYSALIAIYLLIIVLMVISKLTKEKGSANIEQAKIMGFAIIVPIIATIIQIFVYGIAIIWSCVSFALLIILIFVQQENEINAKLQLHKKNEETAVLQNNLTKKTVAVMLSQMKPHFLFNTLTGISVLCDKDSALAKKALVDFSEYLRGNINSLTDSNMVRFAKELEHVKIYTNLEKMRFDDQLEIEYDIKNTNFNLPPLTIQTFVENAIKHAWRRENVPLKITINTVEHDKYFAITISDNGKGFDTNDVGNISNDDYARHIGIINSRFRLENIGADLLITSEIDVGTTVVIKLPKEEVLIHEDNGSR